MSVLSNLLRIRGGIEAAAQRGGRDVRTIRLTGVVKGVSLELIRQAQAAGLQDFAENVVQEAQQHRSGLTDHALSWHFIGHLQTNKVRAARTLFDTIQSVDSLRLAEGLSSLAESNLRIFLEVNVAQEPSKFGFAPAEVSRAVARIRQMPGLDLIGLMTVAPAVDDPEQVRPVFRELRELANANDLPELSMGMSNDFQIAIEEGATVIRLGRAIFGDRK